MVESIQAIPVIDENHAEATIVPQPEKNGPKFEIELSLESRVGIAGAIKELSYNNDTVLDKIVNGRAIHKGEKVYDVPMPGTTISTNENGVSTQILANPYLVGEGRYGLETSINHHERYVQPGKVHELNTALNQAGYETKIVEDHGIRRLVIEGSDGDIFKVDLGPRNAKAERENAEYLIKSSRTVISAAAKDEDKGDLYGGHTQKDIEFLKSGTISKDIYQRKIERGRALLEDIAQRKPGRTIAVTTASPKYASRLDVGNTESVAYQGSEKTEEALERFRSISEITATVLHGKGNARWTPPASKLVEYVLGKRV